MSSNGKSRRRLRRRLAFAAVAVALSLLVAELGLRLVAHATGRDRGVVQDDVLGWRMVPDLVKSGETWCADVPARTNSRGWRDAEPAPTRPPGTRRILALGDSMTFGANVDYGQRFTEHLEDDRTEVLNLAACGYGTDQQVLLYEHEGRDYAADVVMLLVTPYNDLDDIRCSRLGGWSKPWFTIEDDGL
ncbi:MAG: SGNH/GDSL hydrolase family protein, partial [Planctomycetes bacterium]|nr:SGNH/GDSL hydrolase family protein [Planctomycetota bacterium]